MKVSVTARHAEVSSSVREYAELKAGKLLRYFDRLQFVEVILDREHQTWKAEMIATGGGKLAVVAQHTSEEIHAAIDVVVDKLERQLTREKEKRHNHKHIVRRSPQARAADETAAEADMSTETDVDAPNGVVEPNSE